MSNLTKRAMAQALTDLLAENTLDRITIRDITDACGLTRNTFYYHFHDIYELLLWIFREETDRIMARYRENEDWQGGLQEVLTFLYERKPMILHVYRSVSYDTLIRFVDEIVFQHAQAVLSLKADSLIGEGEKRSPEDEAAIALAADFYTNAMVGAVLAWIRADMPRKPSRMARLFNEIFEGTVEGALASSVKAAAWL
ncbi:MAG: TetR/AcrR family transcriptional regulator C-terminal domain-containing protein [Firmicutes bacterium]|nr:TetR/AcrR family transcriptional regulator C-terminal domain-containing protein [Bacillota bacterium]